MSDDHEYTWGRLEISWKRHVEKTSSENIQNINNVEYCSLIKINNTNASPLQLYGNCANMILLIIIII